MYLWHHELVFSTQQQSHDLSWTDHSESFSVPAAVALYVLGEGGLKFGVGRDVPLWIWPYKYQLSKKKVMHSYANQPNFGPNFSWNCLFSSNFGSNFKKSLKIHPFIYATYFAQIGSHWYTMGLILPPILAACPRTGLLHWVPLSQACTLEVPPMGRSTFRVPPKLLHNYLNLNLSELALEIIS